MFNAATGLLNGVQLAGDGGIFKNKPNDLGIVLLPVMPHGYYRIIAGPGLTRWVVGGGGEYYWSPDHYQSFLGPF